MWRSSEIEWSEMPRVLLFSDIHSNLRALQSLMDQDADYYVCAGDLVSWARGLDAAAEIMSPRANRVLIIPGNHESEQDIARLAERFGFRAVHGKTMEIGGRLFGFLGYSNPTPFNTPGEYSEPELAARLELLTADRRPDRDFVLVCHCPPHNTPLDASRKGEHFGSAAVAEFIARTKPSHFFCGHIHEAAGVSASLGVTIGRNLGPEGYMLEW